jgi:Ca-activated chloride channel family protein
MGERVAPFLHLADSINSLLRRACLFLILLSGFCFPEILISASPQASPGTAKPSTSNQEPPTARFKVDVNLTVIHATVSNPGGWVDRSLTREDFELKEEGQKQGIAFFSRESELPLRVALLVDSSLSTARDLKFESEAAVRFFRSVLRPQDGAAVFEFSYDVHQLSNYTNDIESLSRGIKAITPETATSLFDAIYLASETLRSRKQKKIMVIVSDGADTTSRVSYADALRAANEAEAIIFSIIITPVKSDAGRALGGEHALITLSEETGGMSFFPNSIGELDNIYSRISEELRTQYTLGYYSSVSAPSSQLRHITLTTRNPRLTVRTRRGYFQKPAP